MTITNDALGPTPPSPDTRHGIPDIWWSHLEPVQICSLEDLLLNSLNFAFKILVFPLSTVYKLACLVIR